MVDGFNHTRIANQNIKPTKCVDAGLHSIEVRADLLIQHGLTEAQVLDLVATASQSGLAVLFTARHPTHGGAYAGSEAERAAFSERAVAAGAVIVDAELDSEAARLLCEAGAPLLLSHHDFNGMPDAQELATLTRSMEA